MKPEGIQFRTPSENHAAPLGVPPKPKEIAPVQGFTDRALDAYTLQELLDLRARVESRLPIKNLKEVNLEEELVLQVLALKQLQADVLGDPDIAANQKAQCANSLSAALANLVKVQADVRTAERMKLQEETLINVLDALPKDVAQAFLTEYERALTTAFTK